jgi:N-acetylglucosaminyldiphosphoundecaprenol N-acetyl-beta-D-mannosaminyltransferase
LIWSLAEHAAKAGHSLYLLGGSNNAACRASSVLVSRWPQIKIAGWSSPQISSPVTASELSAIRTELCRWRPDLILVAFGSPKQEYLIRALRTDFPAAWMIGCGYGLSFIAGDSSRAPKWMQRAGLEWFHRMLREPRRLFSRYVLHDLPFGLGLLVRSALTRLGLKSSRL